MNKKPNDGLNHESVDRTETGSKLVKRELPEIESALEYQISKNQLILDRVSDGIVTFLPDGRIMTFNFAAQNIFGISSDEAAGMQLSDLFFDLDFEKLIQGAKSNKQESNEFVGFRKDVGEVVVRVTVSQTDTESGKQFVAIFQDLTQSKLLETQLSVSQKMESVGYLAPGIAHEINSPIQYVNDNTRFLHEAFQDLLDLLKLHETALSDYANSPNCNLELIEKIQQCAKDVGVEYLQKEIPDAVQQSLNGTERVAKIATAMKNSSQPTTRHQTAVDINDLIQSAGTISRNEWKYIADLNFDFSEIPSVFCFPSDVNLVFLHLIINSAHAIESRKKLIRESSYEGCIEISTVSDGNCVKIEFRDNGCGIPENIIDKIFDPFFTTKPVGRGMGQGLAIVEQIVEKHGGDVRVESQIANGTTVTLELPIEGNGETRIEDFANCGKTN